MKCLFKWAAPIIITGGASFEFIPIKLNGINLMAFCRVGNAWNLISAVNGRPIKKKKKVRYFNEWNRKGRRKPVSSRTPKTTRQIMELEKLLIHGPLDGQRKGRDEKWANSGKKRGRIEEEDATRGANNCVLLYKSRLFEFGRPIVKNSSATYSERELQETCCV